MSQDVVVSFHGDCITIVCIVALSRTLKFFPNCSIPDLLIDVLSPHGTLNQKRFSCHRIPYITPLITTLLLSRSMHDVHEQRKHEKNAQSQTASREIKTTKMYFQFEFTKFYSAKFFLPTVSTYVSM